MQTEKTEKFAQVCKELSKYFFDVAPDPRTLKRKGVDYEYEEEYISNLDYLKKLGLNGNVLPPPYKLQVFKQSYTEFNNEIKRNIEVSGDGFINKLIAHLFENCLPYEKLLPVEEQFFRERMFDEAELLYNFKAISRDINKRFGSISLMGDNSLPF